MEIEDGSARSTDPNVRSDASGLSQLLDCGTAHKNGSSDENARVGTGASPVRAELSSAASTVSEKMPALSQLGAFPFDAALPHDNRRKRAC